MTLWTIPLLFVAMRSASGEHCAQITGDRISGKDLKEASGEFNDLPDDALVSAAPLPGVTRTLTPRDLARFGPTRKDFCFERSTMTLTREALDQAMQVPLAGRTVTLDIVDFIRTAVPQGKLQFSLSGLLRPPANQPHAPVLWRGRLVFAENKSITIWAMVRISEPREWVESLEPLKPGSPVAADQIRSRSGERFLLDPQGVSDPAEVLGYTPRRAIPAGQLLQAAMFERAPVILKGEPLTVQVVSGALSLQFDALAETNGRTGEQILVFDASRKRRLKVKAIEKGKAILDANDSISNAARLHDAGPGGHSR